MAKRRKLLPKPPEPPEGYMLFYWCVTKIENVEAHARAMMGGHDDLPRFKRDRQNKPEDFRK